MKFMISGHLAMEVPDLTSSSPSGLAKAFNTFVDFSMSLFQKFSCEFMNFLGSSDLNNDPKQLVVVPECR